jgi:hypothetical protein
MHERMVIAGTKLNTATMTAAIGMTVGTAEITIGGEMIVDAGTGGIVIETTGGTTGIARGVKGIPPGITEIRTATAFAIGGIGLPTIAIGVKTQAGTKWVQERNLLHPFCHPCQPLQTLNRNCGGLRKTATRCRNRE